MAFYSHKTLIIISYHYYGFYDCVRTLRITYMYINFQQKWVNSISQNLAHKHIYKKNASCISSQLPIVVFKKSTISDMRHRETYMHINF